jgi:hypothetical protein
LTIQCLARLESPQHYRTGKAVQGRLSATVGEQRKTKDLLLSQGYVARPWLQIGAGHELSYHEVSLLSVRDEWNHQDTNLNGLDDLCGKIFLSSSLPSVLVMVGMTFSTIISCSLLRIVAAGTGIDRRDQHVLSVTTALGGVALRAGGHPMGGVPKADAGLPARRQTGWLKPWQAVPGILTHGPSIRNVTETATS